MVTPTYGILTTTSSGDANRILVDYKDGLKDYKVTDLPVFQMFTQPMQTDTGGNINLSFIKPSMQMQPGNEAMNPDYQHTQLRDELLSVKQWSMRIGVTREMMEDSRFNEMALAMTEAQRAVQRHHIGHVIKTVFGIGDTVFGTGISNASITAASTEAALVTFANNPHGGFFASGATSDNRTDRLDEFGYDNSWDTAGNHLSHYVNATGSSNGDIALSDVLKGIEYIGEHGYEANAIVVSPKHKNTLLGMADFTTVFGTDATKGGIDYVNAVSKTGIIGTLYGLPVFVSAWVPQNRFGVFDLSVKPVAYVERRPLTIEEGVPGYGIVDAYLSTRYGLKVIHPETGVVFINN